MLIEFHRRMLADEVRSAAFEAALRRVIVPGTTVVADIGAGTGILGFMARRLGAREVHLIEHGPAIELAARLADDNGLPDLHFWQMHSSEILDPPQVDVVVAEVLGNFALEENVIETLNDAHRFLRPGGTLIPGSLEQFVAPLVDGHFWRELRSWDRIPLGFDFSAARAMSFDNLYVRRFDPRQLLDQTDAAQLWDRCDFNAPVSGQRRGTGRWQLEAPARIYGFALWWRCELMPGISLDTSPHALPTHWDQIYAPLLEPLDAVAGDHVEIAIDTETGGGEAGIGMHWEVTQFRHGCEIRRLQHDIAAGHLG